MSAWNDFVKKIFHEGRNKNPAFQFKDALKEASRRKGEMSGMAKTSKVSKKRRKSGTKKKRRRN